MSADSNLHKTFTHLCVCVCAFILETSVDITMSLSNYRASYYRAGEL